MELGQYFSAQNLNDYVGEVTKFAQKLGIDASPLTDIPQVFWYTPPRDFKNIFDKMEDALAALDIDIGEYWTNPYSKEPIVFQKKNGSLYPYVRRWYDWLNFNNEAYNIGFSPILYSYEKGKFERVYDINGEPIEVGVA